MLSRFVHPLTKEPLIADMQGNLCYSDSSQNHYIHPIEGCYDFVSLPDTTGDRTYYDEHYHLSSENLSGGISMELLKKLWDLNSSFRLLYDTVGDIRGKKILLLGNGTSSKELRFVAEGADLVYTDISLEAVLSVKKAYERSTLRTQNLGQIQFHAVDAIHLPFGNEAFDIIYGCAFVHHIQDLPAFFSEVHRCLTTGGKCIFLDDAYSRAWQCAKATFLRPLQVYSHWRSGISPEDELATQKGGYCKDELEGMLISHGFKSLIYHRTMFLEHLIRRGSTKLLSRRVGQMFAGIGQFVDQRLFGPCWIERHGMHLVWGFSK